MSTRVIRKPILRFSFLCLFLGLGCQSVIAGPPDPPSGWTDGFVLANGIRIHYWRTGGDKPTMVLLHGYSDNGLCWTQLAVELTDEFDVILPDARGHGLSDPNSESDPIDAQAEDIAGIIRELRLQNPIVMGHSMGASSAAWFAAKHPEIPRAVILEDPRLVPRPVEKRSEAEIAKATARRRLQILAKNNTPYDRIVSDQLSKNKKWGRSEIEIWAGSKRQYHPNTAFRRPEGRPSMSELFSKISAPTLILKADDPPELQTKNRSVAATLERGKLVHIHDAGHNVRRENKEDTLSTIKSFLNDLED